MADPATSPPLNRASIATAYTKIAPHIHDTPVLTSKTLNRIASTPQTPAALKGTQWEGQSPANPKINLFFKCENLQRIGAFKARGAFHAVGRLIEIMDKREASGEQGAKGWRKRGVCTHSSGQCGRFDIDPAPALPSSLWTGLSPIALVTRLIFSHRQSRRRARPRRTDSQPPRSYHHAYHLNTF